MAQALFLTHENPFPPRGSDKLRDFHVLKLLCERFEQVELLYLSRKLEEERSPTENEAPAGVRLPENLVVSPIEIREPGFFHRLFNPRHLNPYTQSVERELEARAEKGKLLWISRLLMANSVPLARSLGYRVVLDEHNVESAVLIQSASPGLKKIPNLFVAAQARRIETRFCLKSNVVVAASNIDAHRLSRIAPGAPVHIIPNSVDHSSFETARAKSGSTLFFSGSLDHLTNIEGLNWFSSEILPRLRANLGNKMPRVVVAGARPSRELQARLKSHGIEVFPDPVTMIPFFSEAAVVFVPVRSGGGTPLKILEAMAAGRPVVSTGKATEGLVLAPTYDILIADNADGFASAILRLLDNQELRTQIGKHASETVLSRYDWRCARNIIGELLKSVELS